MINSFLEMSLLGGLFRECGWVVPERGEVSSCSLHGCGRWEQAQVFAGLRLWGHFPLDVSWLWSDACVQVLLGASTMPGSRMRGQHVSGHVFSCCPWGLFILLSSENRIFDRA